MDAENDVLPVIWVIEPHASAEHVKDAVRKVFCQHVPQMCVAFSQILKGRSYCFQFEGFQGAIRDSSPPSIQVC
jgi:hypothetical protein